MRVRHWEDARWGWGFFNHTQILQPEKPLGPAHVEACRIPTHIGRTRERNSQANAI